MKQMKFGFAALAIACVAGAATAQPNDTIDKIRQTKTITIGNREVSRPFSFLNEQKQPVGYAVDLCLKVVEQLRKDYNLPDLKVKYLTLSGAERIPKLVDGSVDMECGATTNTKARQEKVDFSLTYFIAGMKILARKDAGITDPYSLAGKTVALSKGTTSEKLFTQLHDAEVPSMKLVQYPNNAEALKAVVEGKADAFPHDDILLTALLATVPSREAYKLTQTYLSIEPYAVMVRKGDKRLLAAVDRTLGGLYVTGEIYKIYNTWFDTPTLHIPLSRLLQDSITRPSKDAGVALMLGYAI
jgi:glutamate/aspartate transport system substrate-binding protein